MVDRQKAPEVCVASNVNSLMHIVHFTLHHEVHLLTLDDLIFFMSRLCRIKVPFLNFPTCPAGQMLGTDFFLLAFLKEGEEKQKLK